MRKQPNPSQSSMRQDRIEEIRVLLLEKDLTTGQIEYMTGFNVNSLRHYLIELESKNYISHTKLPVKGSASLNLYRITYDGRSVKPRAPAVKEPVEPDNFGWWQYTTRSGNVQA